MEPIFTYLYIWFLVFNFLLKSNDYIRSSAWRHKVATFDALGGLHRGR